ncbi:MAG: ABC transporter ATP-binding protein [Myxococcaceae bacterium]
MAAVSLQEVHKAYGATKVVKGVSLELDSGGFLALLGPSGCGKTTTLRMIAGLESLDAGRISIGGQLVDGDGTRLPPEKRELGMVFQSYAVWPHRSVKDNVGYPLVLRRLGSAEIDRRVKEALDWVRLGSLADRMPSQLSGGQLQRVAIARALVAQPKVLLLDEPLSNLDMALREELRGEIAALRARLGTTMIFVTHDQHEALALADRVAVMNKGVIEQLDKPEVVYGEPKTAFVAGFVGGANILEGVVEGKLFQPLSLSSSEERVGVRSNQPNASFELPVERAPGPATLAVRPEAVEVGAATGPSLTVVARLFLGSSVEYRLALGEQILRAVSTRAEFSVGAQVCVAFRRVHLF